MNEAGHPINALLRFYKIPVDRLVAIHDELDLPFGTLRVKFGGGDNGHNGLRSLRRSLGTGEFHRVRLGIGRPPSRRDPADFVLSNFTIAERTDVPMAIERAADAVESLLEAGLSITQSRFNS
jgi:PTH1 family peptidyl-tRNA hydrolase